MSENVLTGDGPMVKQEVNEHRWRFSPDEFLTGPLSEAAYGPMEVGHKIKCLSEAQHYTDGICTL